MTSGSARRALRSAREGAGVAPDLALVDQRAFRIVQELDRVLDRQNMPAVGRVDMADQGGKRGRFAAAGRPGDQDQAFGQARIPRQHPGGAELLQRRHLGRDDPEHRRRAGAIGEAVEAEAGARGVRDGDVDLEVGGERGPLRLIEHGVQQAVDLGARKRRRVERPDLAIDPQHGRVAAGQMQVGGGVIDRKLQKPVDVHAIPRRCGLARAPCGAAPAASPADRAQDRGDRSQAIVDEDSLKPAAIVRGPDQRVGLAAGGGGG